MNCGAPAGDIESICNDNRCGFLGGSGGSGGGGGGGGSSVWTDNTSHASFGGFHALKAGQALPATFDDNGTRAFYYHDKQAFRGGEIAGGNDAWQEANIGTQSFAWGYNAQASGDRSIAMGQQTTASG